MSAHWNSEAAACCDIILNRQCHLDVPVFIFLPWPNYGKGFIMWFKGSLTTIKHTKTVTCFPPGAVTIITDHHADLMYWSCLFCFVFLLVLYWNICSAPSLAPLWLPVGNVGCLQVFGLQVFRRSCLVAAAAPGFADVVCCSCVLGVGGWGLCQAALLQGERAPLWQIWGQKGGGAWSCATEMLWNSEVCRGRVE